MQSLKAQLFLGDALLVLTWSFTYSGHATTLLSRNAELYICVSDIHMHVCMRSHLSAACSSFRHIIKPAQPLCCNFPHDPLLPNTSVLEGGILFGDLLPTSLLNSKSSWRIIKQRTWKYVLTLSSAWCPALQHPGCSVHEPVECTDDKNLQWSNMGLESNVIPTYSIKATLPIPPSPMHC